MVFVLILMMVTGWGSSACAQLGKLVAYATRHADIRSDLDRDTVQSVATHYDQLYDGYLDWLIGGRKRADAARPQLVLLDNHQGYMDYLRARGINGQGSGGMFYATREESAMVVPMFLDGHSDAIATLQHEGFHQFVYVSFASPIPPWLNEGLAEYFEDALVRRGQFTTGLIPAHRVDYLRQAQAQGKLTPLVELVGMSQATWNAAVRDDPGRGGTNYLQAWSVVHFLQHGDGEATQRRFRQLMQGLYQGKSYADAMQQAFGPTGLASYEPRWRVYIESKLQPDAFSTTRDRIQFIAAGLRWLHERAPDRMPKTVEGLGEILTQSKFSVRTQTHGIEQVRRADDPRFFPTGDAERMVPRPAKLELLTPTSSQVPPGISAVGVWPRIRLTWERDRQGRLQERLSYD